MAQVAEDSEVLQQTGQVGKITFFLPNYTNKVFFSGSSHASRSATEKSHSASREQLFPSYEPVALPNEVEENFESRHEISDAQPTAALTSSGSVVIIRLSSICNEGLQSHYLNWLVQSVNVFQQTITIL